MNSAALREDAAQKLLAAAPQIPNLTAFIGLDGFVDEIIHLVDKRENAQTYQRLPTIARFAERLAGAAGKSTNIELVNQRTKLGGNGPIMAHALANFGLKVTYLGNLGYPHLHPVFSELAARAEVHSIAEPCHTDALEFEDGKIMLGKSMQLNEITWENILARFGRDRFTAQLQSAHLVGFVNWTMIPCMSEIWDSILREICPLLRGPRRWILFDLADPEKRSAKDIQRALELIVQFQKSFDVVLGLNEKETFEIAEVCGIPTADRSPDGIAQVGKALHALVPVNTLAIHPVTFALAASQTGVVKVDGPFIPKPVLTTGAGDHFNAGFCLGKLLGFENALCVLMGVATSGFYVAHGFGPRIENLTNLLRDWPRAR